VIDEQIARPVKGRTFWRELPILLAVAILVAILVRAFILQTFFIPSGSMEHTLNINDRVLVNKLVYDFRDPARGEVIVFNSPVAWRTLPNEKDFIKRVVGIGGDHVACCDANGRIAVNNVALDEPYLNADGGPDTPSSPNKFDVVVPASRLWVMGDNRFFSGDSRQQFLNTGNIMSATIPVSSVVGRAFVLFWPLGRASWLTVPDAFDHVPAAGSG
jgi:signal peptidase I